MHQQHQIDYRRVERGIAYIAAHFREGPALEDVAAAAHVSPFRFQRMFTAWAGVSPKTLPAISASTTPAMRFVTAGPAFLARRSIPACPAPAGCTTCLSRSTA